MQIPDIQTILVIAFGGALFINWIRFVLNG